MKRFVTFKKVLDEQGNVVGHDLEGELTYIASEVRWNLGTESETSHFELAEGQDPLILSPAWNEYLLMWELVEDADKVFAREQRLKEAQITELYNTMVSDIYDKVELVFKSRSQDNAIADQVTWEKMKENPSAYSSGDLLAEFEVAGFSVGDMLDTDQKVLDYATAKINEIEQYSLWRMQRKQQFAIDRQAILDS